MDSNLLDHISLAKSLLQSSSSNSNSSAQSNGVAATAATRSAAETAISPPALSLYELSPLWVTNKRWFANDENLNESPALAGKKS